MGGELWVSDGSSVLHVWDSSSLVEKRRVHVSRGGKPLRNINELQFDPTRNLIFANIYVTDYIVAIRPETGNVEFVLNMSDLVLGSEYRKGQDVLNGIALI